MKLFTLCMLGMAASAAVVAQSQDNPALGELKTATIKAVYLRGNFPERVRKDEFKQLSAVLSINEWIQGRDYHQVREIYQHFGHHFVLRAAGAPDVKMELINGSMSSVSEEEQLVYLDAQIEEKEWAKLRKGVDYRLLPVDNGKVYQWRVLPSVRVQLH